jgi:hypothetical protein
MFNLENWVGILYLLVLLILGQVHNFISLDLLIWTWSGNLLISFAWQGEIAKCIQFC